MKLINVILSLFFFFSSIIAMDSRKKHIVVDQTDFLIEPDTVEAVNQIGLVNLGSALVRSMLGGPTIQNCLPEFFSVLNQINQQKTPVPLTWKNQQVPYILYESLIASRSATEILKEVENGIKKQQIPNKSLMLQFAKITFDPKINAQTMKIIPKATELLENLNKQGHDLHILGNWNNEAAEKLKKKFPQIFRLFKSIIISGNIGTVKSPEMYEQFLNISQVPPQDTFFIETDESNLEHFYNLNPKLSKPILCIDKDFVTLEKELVQLGLLPQ